jgi:uncharacterized protein (DUF2236 family)
MEAVGFRGKRATGSSVPAMMGVFARMMEGLASEGGEEKVVMIDATYLKAHRTASSLRAQTYGPPRCKRRLVDDISSLHKRIRHVGAVAAAKMEIRASRSS